MKKIFPLIIFALVLGCSIVPRCPDGSRVISRNEFPKVITPDSVQWSIVGYDDLKDYCRCQRLCYEGTFELYHLVRWYEKILPEPQAEFKFAIPIVEITPDTIYQYTDRNIVPLRHRFQKIIVAGDD